MLWRGSNTHLVWIGLGMTQFLLTNMHIVWIGLGMTQFLLTNTHLVWIGLVMTQFLLTNMHIVWIDIGITQFVLTKNIILIYINLPQTILCIHLNTNVAPSFFLTCHYSRCLLSCYNQWTVLSILLYSVSQNMLCPTVWINIWFASFAYGESLGPSSSFPVQVWGPLK